jgi:hypothetical protein
MFDLTSSILLAGNVSKIEVVDGSINLGNAAAVAALDGSSISTSGGSMTIKDRSRIFLSESYISIAGGDLRFENESVFYAGSNSVVSIKRGDLRLSGTSSMKFVSSRIAVEGSVRISDGGQFSLTNSSLEISAGDLSLDSTSNLTLYNQSIILGTGSIDGSVFIDSGQITFGRLQNGTIVPTNLTIGDLKTSNDSSYTLTIGNANGSAALSTVIQATTVQLGGDLIVFIEDSFDFELSKRGGVFTFPFISSAEAIAGRFSNFTVTLIGSQNPERSQCYRVKQTSPTSISILFDSAGLDGRCGNDGTSPGLSPVSVALATSNSTFALAVGLSIAALAVLIVTGLVVVCKVPALRSRFMPAKAAEADITQRQKFIREQEMQVYQQGQPSVQDSKRWTTGVRPV